MSELVIIEKKDVLTVFTDVNSIDPILKKIASDAKSVVFDVSTNKGRKDIASVAYKVSQAKTYLDGLGKDLVDEMKEIPKKIDVNRKAMRDFLDALKDEVRMPLTKWELEQERFEQEKKAEQERLEAERLAKLEAEQLANKIESDHELALLLNADFDRKVYEELKAKEQARINYEAQIAKEAELKAIAAAELKVKAERDEAERKVIDARLATERAEREKLEAETKAVEAAKQAVIAQERAVIAERLRIEKIAEDEAIAAKAREDDLNHKRTINKSIIKSFAEFAGLTEEQSKLVITAIVKKQIPNVNVSY